MSLTPLLAADPGTWITLIFVILGFLGWIMNLAGNKNPPPPTRGARPPGQPPRPVPRNRDERIQSEIDIFLQEVAPKKETPLPRPEPPVVVEERPRPARPPLRRETAPAAVPPMIPVVEMVPATETDRRRSVGQVGSAVREHLASPIETARLEPHVKAHLQSLVDRVAERPLGTLSTEDATRLVAEAATVAATTSPAAAHPLARRLRNPQDVRQAILLSEILGPPPSLRGG